MADLALDIAVAALMDIAKADETSWELTPELAQKALKKIERLKPKGGCPKCRKKRRAT